MCIRDRGKPIRESRDVDVPLAAAHFFYYAGWADKLPWAFTGGVIPRPLGVAAQIIPWNFPLMMAASVSYTHLRAHETGLELVCSLLLAKKKTTTLKTRP